MSGIQTLLIIVVISLTVLLMIIGVQVFLVFMDVRRAVKKLNVILEDSIIGGGLLRPGKLSGILEMFGKRKKMEQHGQGN